MNVVIECRCCFCCACEFHVPPSCSVKLINCFSVTCLLSNFSSITASVVVHDAFISVD